MDLTVVERSPLFFVFDERLADVSERRQIVKTTEFIPGLSRQPGCRAAVWVLQSHSTSQQETPLIVVDFLVLLQDVHAENEREQQLKTHHEVHIKYLTKQNTLTVKLSIIATPTHQWC